MAARSRQRRAPIATSTRAADARRRLKGLGASASERNVTPDARRACDIAYGSPRRGKLVDETQTKPARRCRVGRHEVRLNVRSLIEDRDSQVVADRRQLQEDRLLKSPAGV